MNLYHKLILLSLSMVMVTQTIYANDTEQKELTVNTEELADSLDSDSQTKERFIPVELFTGAKWDGKHELKLREVSTSTCASYNGRPCGNFNITGPFKTESNDTKIEWAGDEVSYYRRTFTIPHRGEVVSFFTINNSKDGLVRIYDKREQWGTRTYNGLGSKFPLGYWKQGEVRTYPSRRPTRIEIIELDGPDHCLTFRWVIGLGKKRNQDNNYTFCPDRGLTNITSNYKNNDSKNEITHKFKRIGI